MMEDPNLIRRPIVLRDARHAIFGFHPDQYNHLA